MNYDGENKHHTEIGTDVFLGCDTLLRAPVTVGDGATTGGGAVVTRNVPAGSLVVGIPARNVRRVRSHATSRTDTSTNEECAVHASASRGNA